MWLVQTPVINQSTINQSMVILWEIIASSLITEEMIQTSIKHLKSAKTVGSSVTNVEMLKTAIDCTVFKISEL